MTTNYTIHDDNDPLVETSNPHFAEEMSRAGFRVTAVSK